GRLPDHPRRAQLDGVLVRDNGVPGWLRVTAGTPAENDRLPARAGGSGRRRRRGDGPADGCPGARQRRGPTVAGRWPPRRADRPLRRAGCPHRPGWR
ncbi:hypothetical protein AB0G09_41600, partial [Kitasatospora aureofaciens]